MKDYFAILGVSPSADISEIKQAYRKLAMHYHPDKHRQDPEKTILYNQIREAYETLTEPVKRNAYFEERWRLKSQGVKLEEDFISGETILKRAITLSQQLRFADPLRLNAEKVRQQFSHVLSDETIDILNKQKDNELRFTVISILLDTLNAFPLSVCREQLVSIEKMTANDDTLNKRIADLLRKKTRDQYWEKNKLLFVFVVTVLICLFIAAAS